ncbi:MAG: hypothetical protein ABL925_11235 [Methylococcales bacterium]
MKIVCMLIIFMVAIQIVHVNITIPKIDSIQKHAQQTIQMVKNDLANPKPDPLKPPEKQVTVQSSEMSEDFKNNFIHNTETLCLSIIATIVICWWLKRKYTIK